MLLLGLISVVVDAMVVVKLGNVAVFAAVAPPDAFNCLWCPYEMRVRLEYNLMCAACEKNCMASILLCVCVFYLFFLFVFSANSHSCGEYFRNIILRYLKAPPNDFF